MLLKHFFNSKSSPGRIFSAAKSIFVADIMTIFVYYHCLAPKTCAVYIYFL